MLNISLTLFEMFCAPRLFTPIGYFGDLPGMPPDAFDRYISYVPDSVDPSNVFSGSVQLGAATSNDHPSHSGQYFGSFPIQFGSSSMATEYIVLQL